MGAVNLGTLEGLAESFGHSHHICGWESIQDFQERERN